MNVGRFSDRRAAGRELAKELERYAGRPDVVVLALPRGGVPVGFELARALSADLDVFVVRKLGVPGHEELGFGAIAPGGVRILNDEVVNSLELDHATIEAVIERESRELERRDRAYRGDRRRPEVADRVAILVDDGLATGSSMRVAIEAVRSRDPRRVVVAVPVAPPDTVQRLRALVDEVVCLVVSERLGAIGLWYEDFSPTTDDEVRKLLAATRRTSAGAPR